MTATRVVYVPDDVARPEAALFAALLEAPDARRAVLLRRAFEAGAPTQSVVELTHFLELPDRLAGLLDCLIAPASGHA